MPNKYKWIYAIAAKNDITNEAIHDYIATKHNLASLKDLNKEQVRDVMKFVSDSRMVKLEKQIYLIMKMAEEQCIDKESLDNMAKKFGSHTMEDLDEKGVRGVLAIVTSIIAKARKNAVCIPSMGSIKVTAADKAIFNREHSGMFRVYQSNNAINIYDADYYMHDIESIAENKTEISCRMKSPTALTVKCGTETWEMHVNKKAVITEYLYRGNPIAITVKGK